MLATEETFFTLAESCAKNCLVICDRGVMDASACEFNDHHKSFFPDFSLSLHLISSLDMSKKSFEDVLQRNSWNTIDLRDNRYNQVIHLITAANGAEEFYNTEDNPCRTEPLEVARELDRKTMESWIGHPYIDVIDNSTDFDTKITRMIDVS